MAVSDGGGVVMVMAGRQADDREASRADPRDCEETDGGGDQEAPGMAHRVGECVRRSARAGFQGLWIWIANEASVEIGCGR